MDSSSKTYIVDFRPIFSILKEEVDEFYFYPKDVHGFIESCVLATQRNVDVESRTNLILDELMGAMDQWSDHEASHEALKSGTWINGKSMNRYLALKVLDHAIAIDTFVYNTMSTLYDAHENLAITEHAMQWTGCNALAMKITF